MTRQPSDSARESSPEQPDKNPDTAGAPASAPPGPRETDEIGGPKGLEPTRYGDWERNGRCIDF